MKTIPINKMTKEQIKIKVYGETLNREVREGLKIKELGSAQDIIDKCEVLK